MLFLLLRLPFFTAGGTSSFLGITGVPDDDPLYLKNRQKTLLNYYAVIALLHTLVVYSLNPDNFL
jgi:hypothetical protein